MRNDAISYVWSDNFVRTMMKNNEIIIGECDEKFEQIKLASLKQLVGSCGVISDASLSRDLVIDFKEELDVGFEKQLLKWIGVINFVDEVSVYEHINYSQTPPAFNASKFYNLLHELDLNEVVRRYTINLALFRELLYYRQFFQHVSNRRLRLTASILFKKLAVFALVWIEKEASLKTSPTTKKLASVIASIKMYAITLSLPITTSRKMFGFFDLFECVGGFESRYEKLIAADPYYMALHDLMYKNAIIQMSEYELSAGHNIQLKEYMDSYTVGEIGELIYDKKARVFEDTCIYEKLHSQDNGEALMNEKTLMKDCSSWFIDLTNSQKSDLLPLITLHSGGIDQTNIIRHNEAWFVNGGEQSESNDEWSIWRKYVVLLTVNYLETIEQNDKTVEVSL